MDEIVSQKKFRTPQADTQLSVLAEENPTFLPDGASVTEKAGGILRRPTLDVLARLMFRRSFVLFVLILWAAVSLFSGLFYPTYVVTLNGTKIGLVRDKSDVLQAMERVEAKASGVLGYAYVLPVQPEFRFTYTLGAQYLPSSAFDSYLTGQVSEIAYLNVLTVNGKIVGAAEDKAALEQVLQQILDTYRTGGVTSASFVEPVSLTARYVPLDQKKSITDLKAILTGNANGETAYTVTSEDTLAEIAKNHGMALGALIALNPGVKAEQLRAGQVLTVQKAVPFLSVRTTKTVTYTKEIGYQVETVKDSSLYQGETKVLTAGKNGTMQVTADQVLINGQVTGQTVTGSKQLTAPVNQVVAEGTAVRPATAAKGYFIWPTTGHVTSQFGYRKLFGSSFHAGIDIANPCGTKIKAADGGTVTFTGYKGTYGNLVIINHGDGRETYYAHCSSILVSRGEKVCQGQLIAKSGRTGRATGNHLHFEVHVGGTAVDPLRYLS